MLWCNSRHLMLMSFLIFVCSACGGKKPPASPFPPNAAPGGPPSADAAAPESSTHPSAEEALEEANRQIETLNERLEEKEEELASLEERYLALEMEQASTLEEVLRSKASLRGVQSRALATSRIAEVRVQLQSVSGSRDREVMDRLRRAEDLLDRADAALAEANYGGAAYLADRAGELARQAKLVSEFRSSAPKESGRLIPIVPPRTLEARVNANLRAGPGTDKARSGRLTKGQTVTAVARRGEWFQVVTPDGTKAWIHRSVVK